MMFWAGSIAIHAAVALALWLRATPPPATQPIVVDYVSEEELRPAPSERARKVRSPDPSIPPKQIVEQEHRLNNEIDKDTRFLSAFDQKVLQQTRAERSGKFNNALHGGKQTSFGLATEPAAKKPAANAAPSVPGEIGSLGQLLPKYDSPSAVDRVTAESPEGDPTRTDDYLKDVKPGLQTLISTREFVYYAYYNRIKAALRSHWEPEVRERVTIIFRQGRSIASNKDRITQVMVTLDARGELLGVRILTQSGIAELDHAAEESFRQAAPFPNPPRGMVDVDGTVKIRWDFVLEV